MYIHSRVRKELFGKVEVWVVEVPDIATIDTRQVDRESCGRRLGCAYQKLRVGDLTLKLLVGNKEVDSADDCE